MSSIFKDLRVFNPDNLLAEMLEADEGTIFCLGETRTKNHEGDDTVEFTFAQIYRAKDEPVLAAAGPNQSQIKTKTKDTE